MTQQATLGSISKGNKVITSKRYLYFLLCCSSIHNSQDTELTTVSVPEFVNKESVVYMPNRLLLKERMRC